MKIPFRPTVLSTATMSNRSRASRLLSQLSQIRVCRPSRLENHQVVRSRFYSTENQGPRFMDATTNGVQTPPSDASREAASASGPRKLKILMLHGRITLSFHPKFFSFSIPLVQSSLADTPDRIHTIRASLPRQNPLPREAPCESLPARAPTTTQALRPLQDLSRRSPALLPHRAHPPAPRRHPRLLSRRPNR